MYRLWVLGNAVISFRSVKTIQKIELKCEHHHVFMRVALLSAKIMNCCLAVNLGELPKGDDFAGIIRCPERAAT